MAVSDRSAEVAPAPAAEGDKEPPAVAVAAPSRDQNPGPAAATEAQVNTIASPSVKKGAGTPRRLPMAGDTAAPKQAGAQLNSQVAATKIQVGEACWVGAGVNVEVFVRLCTTIVPDRPCFEASKSDARRCC